MRSTVPPTLTSAPENQLEGPFAFLSIIADNNSLSDTVGVRRGSETTAQEVFLHPYVANVALMRLNGGSACFVKKLTLQLAKFRPKSVKKQLGSTQFLKQKPFLED